MGVVLAVEGNRWMVTLVGNVGDYPPTNEEAWVEFAKSLPESAIYDLVTSNHPLTDIVSYRIPTTRRKLYEQMKSFPTGLSCDRRCSLQLQPYLWSGNVCGCA